MSLSLHQLKGKLVITNRTPGIQLFQNHSNQLHPLRHDYQWQLKPILPMVHYVVLPPCSVCEVGWSTFDAIKMWQDKKKLQKLHQHQRSHLSKKNKF